MRSRTCFGPVAAGLVLSALVAASVAGEPFTFQAVLEEAGSPTTGVLDLRFRLWDAATGGVQVGIDLIVDDRTVEAGMVTETLDFGVPPDGNTRWLEIAVREHNSSGAFTLLGDRLELSPTPLAVHAARVASAASADDALAVEGESGAYFLDWTNLANVPGDLLDGDGDTLGGLVCSDGEVAKQSGGVWDCAPDEGQVFGRTWVIDPVGDPAANGAALLAALAAIPTPTTAGEAQLLRLEPGRYDLGTSSLQLRQWISLEGSGRSTTVIASSVCISGGTISSAVVESADDTEIRSLTIENLCTGSTDAAVGLLLNSDRTRAKDLLIRCTGTGISPIVVLGDGDDLEIVEVDARSFNGAFSTGIQLQGSAVLDGMSVDIHGSAASYAGAVFQLDSVRIADCFFRATAATADAIGLALPSDAIAERSTVIAQGGASSTSTVGVSVDLGTCGSAPCRAVLDGLDILSSDTGVKLSVGGSPWTEMTIQSSRVFASAFGVLLDDASGSASTLDIVRSTVHGGTNSILVLASVSPIEIANSQLSGGAAAAHPSSPPPVCAGVWDESFTYSAGSACP